MTMLYKCKTSPQGVRIKKRLKFLDRHALLIIHPTKVSFLSRFRRLSDVLFFSRKFHAHRNAVSGIWD